VTDETTPPSQPPSQPPPSGSRLECLALLVRTLMDVATLPFFLIGFVFTRSSHKRWLREAMAASSRELNR
jgi:hypothetical protein